MSGACSTQDEMVVTNTCFKSGRQRYGVGGTEEELRILFKGVFRKLYEVLDCI
jgi:hypothetical protein